MVKTNRKNSKKQVQPEVTYTKGHIFLTKKVRRNLYKQTVRELYKEQLDIVNRECLSSTKREKGGNYYYKSKQERFSEAMSRVAKLLNKELNNRYNNLTASTEYEFVK